MSQVETRQRNKEHVVKEALEYFVKNGIENSKIKDIAKSAGLTERSVYRYFEEKAELVQAASYLCWEETTASIRSAFSKQSVSGMTGEQQIRLLLRLYCSFFLERPGMSLFTLEAEMFLHRAGKNAKVINRPPEKYESSNSPMVCAIRKGIVDGSLRTDIDHKELYYNAYDAILGVLQRQALDVQGSAELDMKKRMDSLCSIFADAFAKK